MKMTLSTLLRVAASTGGAIVLGGETYTKGGSCSVRRIPIFGGKTAIQLQVDSSHQARDKK